MKILVIPDVHLKPHLFTQAALLMEKGIAQRAVSLMDLPDDWNKEYRIELYVETFDAAIAFAKKYPDTLWCYGNHDLCYIWNERESGYSPMAMWTVKEKILELKNTLEQGNEIRYIQRVDDVLFCHGGLSDSFVKGMIPHICYEDADAVVRAVNGLGHDAMWNEKSPIWYRPQFGVESMYQSSRLLQVVGHTPVDGIHRKNNVISCDVFSTNQDGIPIGTQEFLLIDTKTWEFWGIQ